jgi:hypothetical protein
MFCAVWTILVVIFQLIARIAFADRALIDYLCVVFEIVAFLSWFAGWIAVAVDVGKKACPEEYMSCGALKAATVFGAVEWLLFIVTATLAVSVAMESRRKLRTSMT